MTRLRPTIINVYDSNVETATENVKDVAEIQSCSSLFYVDHSQDSVALTIINTWYDIKVINLADGDLREDSYDFIRLELQFDMGISVGGTTPQGRVLLDGIQVGEIITDIGALRTEFITFGIDPSVAHTIQIQERRTAGGISNGLVEEVFITGVIMKTK